MNQLRPRQLRSAITLIEMTTSLLIVSVLLVATGSAIVLASRAMPDRTSGASRLVATGAALDQLNTDLTYATEISELGPSSIAFTVPDRTGDANQDVIRYAWNAAAPGAPLTRSINGAAPAAVLDDVREFALVYDRRREPLPTTYALSGETMLYAQETVTSATNYVITATNWVGQTLRPVFGNDVVWWRVTRVVLQAREKKSGDGESRVQVRGADAMGLPTPDVHDQAVLLESSLDSNYLWREVRFSGDARLTPGEPACIVLQWARNNESCEVLLRGSYPAGGAVLTSTGGLVWLPGVARSMVIRVYGVTAKQNPPEYRYTLNDVRVSIRAGASSDALVNGMIVPANLPEVPPP